MIPGAGSGILARQAPAAVIRWGPVFAGLAVAVALHLLLAILGSASASMRLAITSPPSDSGFTASGPVWQCTSLIVAGFLGGFVAARASGLARSTDGALYGLVCWGALTVSFALVSSHAFERLAAGLGAGVQGAPRVVPEQQGESGPESGDLREQENPERQTPHRARSQLIARTQGIRMPDRFSAAGAYRDTLRQSGMLIPGEIGPTAQPVRPHVRPIPLAVARDDPFFAPAYDTGDAHADWWLFAALAGSLVSGMGGGVLGARAARRHDAFDPHVLRHSAGGMSRPDRHPF